ncbi:hypothetical protein J4E85_007233 [Alternaria conjuncta]|uniref:uncharacterized protein n=1 Tax=Alternaria conjuncta TaxID=181017 RepID=UPI0022202057|nr:uncharacterized protein J4E85_007233 [Alternaria conjuncta]KAI4925354.1 hypothetical protein J4E85_007233 [Alternaria conjuncta]
MTEAVREFVQHCAAYITALEKRLADTEAALSATLTVVQNQDLILLNDVRLPDPSLHAPKRQGSKAEKLEEWKRLPLQTTEQLTAWLQAQCRETAAPEVFPPRHSNIVPDNDGARKTSRTAEGRPNSGAHASRQIPGDTSPPVSVLQQLEDCEMPIAPNMQRAPTDPARWHENYF